MHMQNFVVSIVDQSSADFLCQMREESLPIN